MGVTSPSVTAMLKKLTALGLAEHKRYRGVQVTQAGEKIAIEVIRHHRLLELYLTARLGLGIDARPPRRPELYPTERPGLGSDAVHAEADRLELALSEELEAKIDETLGFPTHD